MIPEPHGEEGWIYAWAYVTCPLGPKDDLRETWGLCRGLGCRFHKPRQKPGKPKCSRSLPSEDARGFWQLGIQVKAKMISVIKNDFQYPKSASCLSELNCKLWKYSGCWHRSALLLACYAQVSLLTGLICPQNSQSSLSPEGLCICCSLSLEYSSSKLCKVGSFLSFRSQPKCHFLREAFSDYTIFYIPSRTLCSFMVLMTLIISWNYLVWFFFFFFGYLSILPVYLQQNVSTKKARAFFCLIPGCISQHITAWHIVSSF